jgi:outer membrane translocation and assembly module TamA
MAFAGDTSRWLNGRLHTTAGAGVGKVNLDFYGAGLDQADLEQSFHYSLQFKGGVAQANWQLAERSRWSVGLRYVYADVTPELRDSAAAPELPNRTGITVSAPTAILEYDSRDNILTPTRGLYSETSYLASREALGASEDFERFQEVLLGWLPLPHEVTLGARADYAWASQSTPFFLKPYIQLRGVAAMRYQGAQVASLEVEARWQFYDRWSLVPFLGVGATRLDRSLSSSNGQSVGSGGIGFRYEVARKFGLHAGLDLAHSPGTTAVYIQIGNAWFRP